MNEIVKLVIYGEPKGKARPRYSRKAKRVYTPTDTVNYENLIRAAYWAKYGNVCVFPKDMPLDMRIRAYYEVPRSDSVKCRSKKLAGAIRPTKKPDWDNIGKIAADALNKVAYYDDAQVVDAQIRKFYSNNPRVEIIIKYAGGKSNE